MEEEPLIDQDHVADEPDRSRLREDLDRFMQSSGLREARDIVVGNPGLMGPEVATYLGEAIKRLRQVGNVATAESCEHWLGLLRRFREFGVEDGYLEYAIEAFAHARSPDEHRRILHAYPELGTDTTLDYLRRRIAEASRIADVPACDKYRSVYGLVQAGELLGPPSEELATTVAVNAFLAGFVDEADTAACRRLLESTPGLLQQPLSIIVGAMFGPSIERARAVDDLVRLRGLLLRQALFERCHEVGIRQAFDELAEGVQWKQLTGKG